MNHLAFQRRKKMINPQHLVYFSDSEFINPQTGFIFVFYFVIFLSITRYFYIKTNQIIYSAKIQVPCKYVKYYYLNRPVNCQEKCFHIKTVGRFGNQMIAFLRTIQLAKNTDVRLIFYSPGFIMQNRSFHYTDIQFEPTHSKIYKKYADDCYASYFYIPTRFLPRLPLTLDPAFKAYFISQLPKVTIPKNSLVIHVRSGDIFKNYIHPNYGQPPCGYYKDVIKMKKWPNVIIASENNLSPCVDIIANETKQQFKRHSFKMDLSIMLHAHNIVLSRGTLGIAVLMLSQIRQKVYMFNMSSSRLVDHMNCIPTDQYYKKVLKKWGNNVSQIEMMKNSSCKKWVFVPKGPNFSHIFIHERIL